MTIQALQQNCLAVKVKQQKEIASAIMDNPNSGFPILYPIPQAGRKNG
jgi:hypothetical protein